MPRPDLDAYGLELAELVAKTELLKRSLSDSFDDRKDRRDIGLAERRLVAVADRYCKRIGLDDRIFQAAIDRVIRQAEERP